ncbi:MAG: SUF system NifU family Fe-S cluster assembly protein [Thermoanaerobaculales bacterium]|jgi:nitrogen fixation NifU-like protein|nr:SUF system NifU family Fe-S cluster assembly protein [Thermoanaerobaculales bacterium]
MSDMRELYQEIILDHNKQPRNCYVMDCAHKTADGHNPLCGDTVKVYLRISDGVISEISFQGAGCAICTASTSLMTESVKGKTVEEAKDLFDEFHHMLTGVAAEQGVELGKLRVFEGVREYPVRVKCATLAWHTLNAAMDGADDKVTTE